MVTINTSNPTPIIIQESTTITSNSARDVKAVDIKIKSQIRNRLENEPIFRDLKDIGKDIIDFVATYHKDILCVGSVLAVSAFTAFLVKNSGNGLNVKDLTLPSDPINLKEVDISKLNSLSNANLNFNNNIDGIKSSKLNYNLAYSEFAFDTTLTTSFDDQLTDHCVKIHRNPRSPIKVEADKMYEAASNIAEETVIKAKEVLSEVKTTLKELPGKAKTKAYEGLVTGSNVVQNKIDVGTKATHEKLEGANDLMHNGVDASKNGLHHGVDVLAETIHSFIDYSAETTDQLIDKENEILHHKIDQASYLAHEGAKVPFNGAHKGIGIATKIGTAIKKTLTPPVIESSEIPNLKILHITKIDHTIIKEENEIDQSI
ncbi:MAG TPA: hypothetical protein VGP47_06225 [Parachlamydiaceae bacterium]|nr:hypothetical protein [Parachlamydiaceae bacterium]